MGDESNSKKEMKIWKDKQGNRLTYKEFIGRWKEGIEEITPIQKIKTQLTGTRISLTGIFLGICVTLYGWENLWWVAIILVGAFITTGVSYLGIVQQRDSLLKHEEDCEEMSMDDLMEEDVMVAVDGEEQEGMSSLGVNAEDFLELNKQEVKDGHR